MFLEAPRQVSPLQGIIECTRCMHVAAASWLKGCITGRLLWRSTRPRDFEAVEEHKTMWI